jgi:type I restriction enzyme S subunit
MKSAYKQTDIGLVPVDWEVTPLGELATVSAGGTPSRAQPQYWNGSIPWVTTSELDFYTITSTQQSITLDGLNNSAAKLVPPGTLLIALYGQGKTRGKIGILGIEAATNQACAAISLRSSVSTKFVFHFLASQYENIRRLSNTGNQENLNGALVRSIAILCPPLDEQRLIATALDDVDALLEGLDRLIAKKRDLKQAALQQLLSGETRLPGAWRTKAGFKQTAIGMIPSDWDVKPLGAILTRARLGGNYANQGTEAEYPLMKMGNIGRGRFDMSKLEFISAPVTPESAHCLVAGDVLFNTRNTLDLVGKVAIWRDELPIAYYNSNLLRLEFDSREISSNEYANYALNAPRAVARLRGLATGTTSVAAIYTKDLMEFQLIVPSKPEQAAIGTALSDMDNELATLEQRRDKTRALKQGMMQELLTGRTRVISRELLHA